MAEGTRPASRAKRGRGTNTCRLPISWVFADLLCRGVTEVRTHAGELFFGFDDLELGLRLAATGYTLYIHADLWKELREYINAEEPLTRPSLTLQEPTWRRYYALRNVLYLLICGGRRSTALQIALVRGFAKPLLSLPITPRLAVLNLCINVRAIKDAWTGRMGLTVQPNNDPRDH